MQPNGVPGYAMCVVKDGSQVYSKGFGVAELGADRPVTPQSVFAIASTTKSFTGVALMQLVEQGKVDLDAPVTAYLPYFEMADPTLQGHYRAHARFAHVGIDGRSSHGNSAGKCGANRSGRGARVVRAVPER